MVELRWDGNDFRNSQDSSGTVADNISRNGKLQQGYKHGSLTEGLVAYYPMEKGQGEILHDAAMDNLGQIKPGSSGGNTSARNMWTNDSTIGNNSLNFDGTDDYVEFDKSFDSGNGDITFSVWVKTSLGNDLIRLLSNYDGGAGDNENSIRIDNGKPNFLVNDGSTNAQALATTDISDNTWHHILGRRRGGTVEIFIDGIKEDSDSPGLGDSTKNNNHFFGRSPAGGNTYFEGLASDLRIYQRALSEPEIKALHNISQPSGVLKKEKDVPGQNEGGVSRYKLNGTADDSWSDNHGTNNGADLTATGVHGDAAKFDGNSDNIDLDGLLFDGSEAGVSVSAWVNPSSTDSLSYIHNQHESSEEVFYDLAVEDGGTVRLRINPGGAGGGISTSNSVQKDAWSHIVGTWNESTNEARIYINSTVRKSDLIEENWGSAGSIENVRIGARTGSGSQPFHGKIDDVRIYNQALTPVQVEKLYHKGAYRISRSDTLH